MGRHVGRARAAIFSAAFSFALVGPAPAVWAQGLTGTVSSAREGAMEGVVVSARRAGSPITVSVVSNATGGFAFPADRLVQGRYTLSVRAIGYDLDAPREVEIGGAAAKAELKLVAAKDITSQLTPSEWIGSAPGSFNTKRFILGCQDCHHPRRIFESKYSPDDFLKVFERMSGYYPGASDIQPQRLVGAHRRPPVPGPIAREFATYLSSINLYDRQTHAFEIKTHSRPTGRATRVIVTEYDLPRREIQPHDVIVDPDGMVWYSHFGEQFLSRLDPKTGAIKDFSLPVIKPEQPKGTLDLELDHEGNIWIAMMYQSGMSRFDRKTETLKHYPIPADWQREATQQSHFSVAGTKVDGKAWVKNTDGSQVYVLDVATGQYENLGSFKRPDGRPIAIYGLYADQQNNVYLLEFSSGGIGKIDSKTRQLTYFPTPTNWARARRGRVDHENRLWFAEYGGNGVGVFDPKTEKITEWKKPLAWESPYDVVADRFGEAWEVNEASDRVGRLNPKTGEWTNYLMPRYSNFRRVFVDDSGARTVVWIGNNLGASVVRVEPLD